MPFRQFLATSVLTLALVGAVSGQTVMLREAPLVDSCCRIKMTLDLKGRITFQQLGKTETIEHAAVAEHSYTERVLEVKGAVAEKSARFYQVARATIAGQTRTLRPERAFMVAHRYKDQLVVFNPKAPLLSEEMELLEHFDTLSLPGLLPGREVKVGDSWSIPTAVIQALCGLDALDAQAKQDLTGQLSEFDGNRATIVVQGAVKGIQLGAQISILVSKSRLVFDAKEQRIVEVEWRQSDQRQQGPATPNLSADVTIQLKREPSPTPPELGQFALVEVPDGPPPAKLTNVVQRDALGKYEMQHSREWQFVGERNGQRVLKLVTARGDYLADAIVMPWKGPKVENAQAFKLQMEETPGWRQDGETQLDDAVKHPGGYKVFRAAASGKLEGVPAFRSAYLLGNTAGQQLLVTIIAPPGQVNNLEARDQILVEGIELK